MLASKDLRNLEKDCTELLNAALHLGCNENSGIKEAKDKLITSLRKIILAYYMKDTVQAVICVTGLQGAGKTTMMKNFYHIPDGILNVSLGRGETLPIFIREKANCKKPELQAVCIRHTEDTYESIEIPMTEAEFAKASGSNGELDAQTSIMYLEVRVPYCHFCREEFAFVLLPGFERKRSKWQELIDFSVKCADTAVFVFDGSGFSMRENKVRIEKAAERFGSNLIYAISHSDSSEDNNEEIKKTTMETLPIHTEQSDRVVCVGDYGHKEQDEKWINALKRAITRYANNFERGNRNCEEYIKCIIEEDIMPAIDAIQNAVQMGEVGQIYTELQSVSPVLNAFDEAVKKRRKLVEKNLDRKLKEATSNSIQRLQDEFKQKNVLDKLQRQFFGVDVKAIEKVQNMIKRSMKDPQTEAFFYETACAEAVGDSYRTLSDANKCKELLEGSGQFMLARNSVAKRDTEKLELALVDAKQLIANPEGKKGQLQSQNPKDVVECIVDMCTQYYGLNAAGLLVQERPELKSYFEKMNITSTALKDEMASAQKVMFGMLGITGVDIMSDGVLNGVPMLAEALGISIFSAAAGVVGISLAIGGAAVLRDINRVQLVEMDRASNVIENIHENVKNSFLELYDEAMDIVKKRIDDNLQVIYDVNAKARDKMNVQIAIHNINERVSSIYMELNGNVLLL